jgi:hypothetical protein
VQDGRDVVVEVAVGKARGELSLSTNSSISQSTRFANLSALREVVDGDDLADAAPVERLDEIGADESGGPVTTMRMSALRQRARLPRRQRTRGGRSSQIEVDRRRCSR